MPSTAQSGRLDVLMIVDGEIATVYIVEATLKACSALGIDVRKKLANSITAADFGPNTIPLFVRCANPILSPWVDILHAFERPFFYYIDDGLWKLSGDSAVARYYRHPLIQESFRKGMSGAAAVFTNSVILAEDLRVFTDRIKILPPIYDFSAIEGVKADADGELRIGFAGSTSRVDDLEIITPAIARLLKAYPEVVFEFAGAHPSSLPPSNQWRFFPHVSNYDAFARFQASRGWSIGLAPLRDTPANRCKTDNKYREYGACRIAGVYSDLPPYRGSVRPDETGVLAANDPDEWYRAVARLIENPEERARIGANAFEDVWARYHPEAVAREWSAAIVDGIPAGPYRSVDKSIPLGRQIVTTGRHWAIQMADVYQEGGILMVLQRVAARLSGSA